MGYDLADRLRWLRRQGAEAGSTRATRRAVDGNVIDEFPVTGGGAVVAAISRFPVRATSNGKGERLMFVCFSRVSRFPDANNRTGDPPSNTQFISCKSYPQLNMRLWLRENRKSGKTIHKQWGGLIMPTGNFRAQRENCASQPVLSPCSSL